MIKKIKSTRTLLLAILLVAAILRFVGTNPGYNQFHADEGISYSAASSMVINGNLDPLRYDYPALVPVINNIFFRTVFIPITWAHYYLIHVPQILDGTVHIPISPLEASRIFRVFIMGERDRNALFWGRYVTAFFSLGNVLLTYLVAKRLYNKKVGLIAALLLTFNFKHVINSHIGLPDIYNSFFVLLAFLMAYNLWKNPNRKNYLLAGISAGLSVAVKYQFFVFAPLLLAHLYASVDKNRINIKKLISPKIILLFIVSGLLFIAINPYHFLYLDKTIEIVRGVSQKYAMGMRKINLYPFSYFYHIDYGPAEFLLIIVGALIALRKYLKSSLFLFAFLAPFSFVFFYYSNGGFYVRNFITITPILLIFAAITLDLIYVSLQKKLNRYVLYIFFLGVITLVVFVPARNAITNTISYTQPWGYDQMKPWIQKNLPTDVIVAVHPFDASNLGIKNKTTEFEIAGAYSLQEHRENGAKYAIMDLNWAGTPFYFWMGFGFDQLSAYWNKPIDMMRNTFHGIAAEELFRYAVHNVTKPWQAPDTHIIVALLPQWPQVKMVEIKRFSFDTGQDEWSTYGSDKTDGENFVFDQNTGNIKNGSLLFQPIGAKYPGVRMTSKPISVKEGYLYEINGYLKTEKLLAANERDGFIRVDFYGDNYDFTKVGNISSVSARVYGTTDWVLKNIKERAPKGAKFMTVSFETYYSTRTKIWLDDVSVSESLDSIEDITSKSPYDIEPIDLNYLYPNSHGNL